MQAIMVNGTGFEDLATDDLDGVLFNSRVFGIDPRLSGLVNEAMAAHNDLPMNLNGVLDALRRDMSDAQAIVKLVELNPALAAKVLKLVNTSFPGLRGKISNLKRGVNLLGFNLINSFLNSSSAFMKHDNHKLPPTLPLGKLWQHSVAVGHIAGAIGEGAGNLDVSTLLSCGLLHDVGKLVLAMVHPEKFASCVMKAKDTGEDLVEIELETMGLTHPILSGALCRMWSLPERLWTTLLYQEHPNLSPNPRMTAALSLAQFIAREHELGFDAQVPDEKVISKSAEILGVPVEKASRLVDHLKMDEIIKDYHLLAS